MEENLRSLLASFEVLEHKIHYYHVKMTWELFLLYHPFYQELYDYFDQPEDEIMERLDQLGMDIPSTLLSMVKESVVDESKEDILDIKRQLECFKDDFDNILELLQDIIKESWDVEDYVTQNMMIGYQQAIQKLQWKINKSLNNKNVVKWKTFMAFEDGVDWDDD